MIQSIAVKERIPQAIGVYHLGEEIGRGSVAVVYRATDTLYDREVALKVLHPYFAHYLSFVRYFIAEGREGMRLRHPNIIQVFDAGQTDGISYIAQELITGGTLADMIQARGGPFTVDETVAVIEQAAAGLDYAHRFAALHRNLKPSNIFFADHGRVQIGDFRAALTVGAPPPNYPVGTPTFMAPEQARGETSSGQRADIYSLGAIAFLMITGRPPFEADNPLVLLRKISDELPPLLERILPGSDPAIGQVMSQVLAKKPNARYVTASAFAQALSGGEPLMDRRASSSPPVAEESEAVEYIPPVPRKAVSKNASRSQPRLARRTVMLLAMLGVTMLLLLLVLAFRAAPLFFDRLMGIETPERAPIAVVPTQSSPAATATLRPTMAATATPATTLATVGAVAGLPTSATPGATRRAQQVSTPLATLTLPRLAMVPLESLINTATPLATATAALAIEEARALTITEPITEPLIAPPITVEPTGRIAYSVWNPRSDRYDVVVYNLQSGARWPVLASKRQPDFNNQSDLLVNSEGGGYDNLVIMRLTGELVGVATAFAEDSHPHWSPNNKMLVFASTLVGDNRYRLYLQQDTNYGQKVGPLMYDAWEIFGQYPIFLLDDRIAYNGCNVWENASTCGLFVVTTDGSQPENLTNWPGDIPTDNLGANILAMSDREKDWNVYLVNAGSGALTQLTDDEGNNGLATASPDATFIAFVSDRAGPWAVYIMRPDGSDQRKLFDLDGSYGRGEHAWHQERLSWGR